MVHNNYCLLFKSLFLWKGESWTLLEKAPATIWVPGIVLGSPPHLLDNSLLLFHAVLSCPARQLWTIKVPPFTAGCEDGNAQQINSEPPDINRHPQSQEESRASPAAAGTALLASQSPSLQQGRSSAVTSGTIAIWVEKSAWHYYLSVFSF